MRVTFDCSSNIALLLITFHDLVSGVAPDDSIAMQDFIEWLIDEIGGRSEELAQYAKTGSGLEIGWQLRMLIKYYRTQEDATP